MPHFYQEGDVRFASLITGPSHNLLELEFGSNISGQPVIEARPAVGACDHGRIDEAELLKAVVMGVADADASGSVPLSIRRIVYVVNDSLRYDAYRHCAKLLARRMLADCLPGGRADE